MKENINLRKTTCTACKACANICPKDAISFSMDEYGFDYPIIDAEKCIECNLCEKICSRIAESKLNFPIKAFAATNKNRDILLKSSSGGVFSCMAKYVLKNNGAVCGCVYDENLKPMHICSEDQTDVLKIRKSKYVQSDVGHIYREIKFRLEKEQTVLFTGTPCQVDALKTYLGKDYNNLITMDLICHGVPSESMFKKFLMYLEQKHKTKITNFDFRSKRFGWQRYTMEFTDEKGKRKNIGKTDEFYMPAFTNGNIMRPSCFSCRYATDHRAGDITIGDFWGYEKLNLTCDTINGVSVCTLNTPKAVELTDVLNQGLIFEEIDYNVAVNGNTCLRHPTLKGDKWDKYMQAFKEDKISEIAILYQNKNKKARLRGKIKLLVPLRFFKLIRKMRYGQQ